MNLKHRLEQLENERKERTQEPLFAEMIVRHPEYPGQPYEEQPYEVWVREPGGGLRLTLDRHEYPAGPNTKFYSGIDVARV